MLKALSKLLLLFILICSCKPDKGTPEVSFYYWKTIFKLNETEKTAIQKNHIKNLYIRYFDIDLQDEKPIPVSPVKFEQKPDNIIVIPVVYIKNKVMLKKDLDIGDLTGKIIAYTNQINSINKLSCDEMQIDCDWSLESRDMFMKFMALFKKKWKKTLSVTIRLHQVKYYYKTKVPAADYGVLMYYNMGKISADSLNSIYDKTIADKYLKSLKFYPLNIDIALPIFSQGVHIRDKKVINLLSKINPENFLNDTNYRVLKANRILVKNSNIKSGFYFVQNDEIKIESISFDDIKEMAKDLNNNLAKKSKQIIFFDLDSINLNNYNNENQDFSEITGCF